MKNALWIVLILIVTIGCNNKTDKKSDVKTETISDSDAILPPPSYNVYIENSASMDGYVKGITEFEQSVYNYLSDIKISRLADSLNLFYINSKPILYGSDVADFIEKLEPTTFKNRGGDRKTTDISNVLNMILENTDNNTVSLLVSDFIFSPGKDKDAEQYLVNQQIGIKNTFAEHLRNKPEHAVVVYHLESKFDGIYYDKDDKKKSYKGNRPFYIWIVGHQKNVAKLISECPPNKFKGSGVKNSFSIIKGGAPVKYAIHYGSGNFKLDKKDPKKSIIDARKDAKGSGEKKLRFSIAADFSSLLCDDSYLLNTDNYILSDKDYEIEVTKSKSNPYTHLLRLSTEVVKPTTLTVKLKTQVPQWISEVNDNDGIGISSGNSGKTFGFYYLISGVYEAFIKDGESYTTITVNVNKK